MNCIRIFTYRVFQSRLVSLLLIHDLIPVKLADINIATGRLMQQVDYCSRGSGGSIVNSNYSHYASFKKREKLTISPCSPVSSPRTIPDEIPVSTP
jgi:hypothetical protein